MDFIFGLITPYVEFSTNYYSNVLIICLILSVTGFIGYIHIASLRKVLEDTETLLGIATLLIISSFAWPLVVFFLGIGLLCVFYYYLVGFLINLILKRFK